MKSSLLLVCLLLAFAFSPNLAEAHGKPKKPKSASAPLDGGLAAIAAAGLLYGVKKARDKRKKFVVSL